MEAAPPRRLLKNPAYRTGVEAGPDLRPEISVKKWRKGETPLREPNLTRSGFLSYSPAPSHFRLSA